MMKIKTTLYISRLNRYIMGNHAPIICHAIGKKQFEKCVCDCKDICKKTPGTTNNRNKFNYVDNFDYEIELSKLLIKKQGMIVNK